MGLAFVTLVACEPSKPPLPAEELEQDARIFESDDPIERACDLSDEILVRTWRGYMEGRSEDISMVAQFPNFSGTFTVPNHSGPWDYLQNVPLIFYGPGHIEPQGQLDEFASLADIYPTMGRLAGVPLENRSGRVLEEALVEEAEPPKLVVFLVWDGAGRNMLERWPDAWPTLAKLENEGTSYLGATVGSSPSITPATHATMGTGAFPNEHGAVGIKYRNGSGAVTKAFQGRDPRFLETSTWGDDIDLALDNEPVVGMLAWRSWHMGMLGHGSQYEGADKDLFGLIGDGQVSGNDEWYETPQGLSDPLALRSAARSLDREDGEADGEWMGHDILEMHDNPAWVRYQSKLLIDLISNEGFGADHVPDLLSTNFKMTDIVGHQYGMDSKEEEAILKAQDDALEEMLDHLDETVGSYVVIMTSDHGHTPSTERTGAWPVNNTEVKADINRFFESTEERPLVQDSSAVGVFLDKEVMAELDVTEDDVARFLNGYRLADNWPEEELPDGYEDRADENLFSATFPLKRMDEVMKCAFGSVRPPDLDA